MNRYLVVSLILFLLVLPVASAQYPSFPEYVNDYANLLSPSDEALLTAMMYSIEQNTTVEIVVVTVQNTGGEDPVQYAAHAGEQNGIGKAATDNGIVILWSVANEHGGAIATGRGIESTVTDAKASAIGRAATPYFDRGDYSGGFTYILSGIDATVEPPNPVPTASVQVGNLAEVLSAIIAICAVLAICNLRGLS